MAIRLVIYEDNKELLFSLGYLFRQNEQFDYLGGFAHCMNAIAETREFEPDVVLMDIDMPGMSGIEGVKLIKSVRPETHVIMHTVFEDSQNLFDAILAGASGYILKKATPQKVIEGCIEAFNGGAPMSPAIARQVLARFQSDNKVNQDNNLGLTPKEKEVLGSLVKGNSYKMIAADLGISIDTVRSHIRHIYEKLHVNSMTEAVAKAIKDKLV